MNHQPRRCPECGAYLDVPGDCDRITELPRALFGLPVHVLCDACMAKAVDAGAPGCIDADWMVDE